MRIAIALFILFYTTQSVAVNAPAVVSATASGNSVTVMWSGADPLAWGHNIFRDDQYVGTSYNNSYSEEGISNGAHQYYVSAFASGQYSPPSQRVSVTVGGTVDACIPGSIAHTTISDGRPSAPNNFRVSIYSPNAFELMWDRSADDGYISGYELKRDGELLTRNDALSYYEGNIDGNRTYLYELAAVDNAANRSTTTTLSVNPTSGTTNSWISESPDSSQSSASSLPSNNREASGRAVIVLEGSGSNHFKNANSRNIYVDSMPDQEYFVDRGPWTCSYYSASDGGFLIEPTYRSSTWIFYKGGAGSYNGQSMSWSANNTDISMANMFFDLVEVESVYQGFNSEFRYQNTMRFWETKSRYFECQASSNKN
jgi:hypothetical protein